MKFDHVKGREVKEKSLPHNSLLVFSRDSQCHWKHSIPVDPSVHQTRYSITVRDIEPFNVNSTYLYGDSNTAFIKFGEGPKTLGRWCPGQRIKTSRVSDLPAAINVPPVRNMIIHTGINDIRDRYSPLSPLEIVQTMENKCAAIHRLHPQMRIFISPILPTRDENLNYLVRQTNGYLYLLTRKHVNLYMTDNKDFADSGGFLIDNLASRKANDTVHLNLSGIIKLGMLFKRYATSLFIRGNFVDGRPYAGVSGVNSEKAHEGMNRAGGVSRVGGMRMMTTTNTSNTRSMPPQQIPS